MLSPNGPQRLKVLKDNAIRGPLPVCPTTSGAGEGSRIDAARTSKNDLV
jgi:hypothetical protein